MEYFAFGETFVEEHRSSNNSPYKFNGKELDEETGWYYYGARYYDARTSIWLSVDPLANVDYLMNDEAYINGEHNGGVFNSFNHNSYGYCYQNPVILIDPNGKQVVPKLYEKTDAKGKPIPQVNKGKIRFMNAMKDFAKTTYGSELIANFTEKGYSHFGVKGNGKYTGYKLMIHQLNFENGQDQFNYTTDSDGNSKTGSLYMQEIGGKLFFVMTLDLYEKDSKYLAETITHELALHGYLIEKLINLYEESGYDAASEYFDMMTGDQGINDHCELINPLSEHEGALQYKKTRDELIKINPEYEEVFKKEQEKYESQY
ncbi:MAG: RHS repeat-associated core domain-containing protein [Moheibacter sp.]